jgi:hypothetical protein
MIDPIYTPTLIISYPCLAYNLPHAIEHPKSQHGQGPSPPAELGISYSAFLLFFVSGTIIGSFLNGFEPRVDHRGSIIAVPSVEDTATSASRHALSPLS